MYQFLAALLLALLLPACAGHSGPRPAPIDLAREDPFDASYKVHCDTVSGNTICVMTGNALRPFSPRYPLLSLGLISEVGQSGRPRYFLRLVYVNKGQWLNIGRGPALRLTIDGESLTVSGKGSQSTRYTGEAGKLYEVAIYETSAETIRQIATAAIVTVRLHGDFDLEKSFGKINFLYFRQFIQHYLDEIPAVNR